MTEIIHVVVGIIIYAVGFFVCYVVYRETVEDVHVLSSYVSTFWPLVIPVMLLFLFFKTLIVTWSNFCESMYYKLHHWMEKK